MEIKRKTEIFVETSRRFVIHGPEKAEQVVCSQCGEPMLAAEQAAALLDVGRRTIYQTIENGTSHFFETEKGVLMVCPNSLAEYLENQK